MKRREVLQTAASALVGALSVSTFSSYAAKSNGIALKPVDAAAIPKGDVPILTPENVYAMPPQFWQGFEGKLWIGKAGVDASKPGNQIPVFLRDASGKVSEIAQPIALNKGNFAQFIQDNAALIADPSHSMTVEDNNGQTLFNIADVSRPGAADFSQRLAQPAGYQLIGEIASVAELRKTRPLFEGAKVKLKSWHEGREVGGGEFVGSFQSTQNDGGVNIAGEGFSWRRVVDDFNRLTLFDFGAIADGQTDTAPAIMAMFNWSQQANQQICVQFPAGTFMVSACNLGEKNLNLFRISGAMVNFGYFPATTIVSDGKSDFVFEMNARRVELSNLIFNGNSDKSPNQQGFFHNTCPGGQFFRGACLRFTAVGGTAISLQDTLDCKIDQWYASRCSGDVIKSGWSGQKQGNWDHSTAIELSNFNAQHCRGGKVLNLARCAQSIIHNGWIEHCDNPGDISNGQWIIDALSLEDCKNPLIAHNSRLNMRQTSLQSGSWIDNSMQGDRLLSIWEMGSTRVESYGVALDGSLNYNYITSRWRLENNTNQETWFDLGSLYSPTVGDSWEIEIFGQSQFSNGSGDKPLMNLMGDKTTGGRAVIHVQRKKDLSEASWSAEGSSPIVDVRYVAEHDSDVRIFVKLAGWTPSAAVLVKTTGKDRFVTGRCARVNAKMEKGNPPSGDAAKRAPQRFSLHNGKAGVGANEQGDLLMASRPLSADQVDTSKPEGFVSVVINGKQVALPYFAIKS
ncbi:MULTISPECIES: phage tailspike protein [Pantoea]|uniref:Amylovoran biosynthesis protein AmsF n=1 Tax=Candidatus Pantoea gossypiicola TaxID=2608008 RepID=A0AB34CN53_9GAMM|nr:MULTISPECIES: phage tailspike protein [Pantoea]KAA5933493.1 amylovoran biosynthesis protein AmsF [Pantoea sp. VH_8]KAA5938438.1 amylovoran biosynthesis protein AmsF [Pantoea sp. VH_4]KAA5990367.1 amylovoran biosynthesis protein AmsF [Pantoea sp. M_4]KAA6128783.1 amylovoran biosynthesis protein AmsF [Pantoea gossypiicola]